MISITEYIDSQKDMIIKDLMELVKIESVSENIEEVKKALHFVLDLGRKMGFKATVVLNDQVGVVELGEGTETLGILTHVDVVPPGDLDSWHTPPFDPVVKDGYIWGRGTLDDKGPIISCLYAMKAVKNLGRPLKKKVQLIIGTQEEVEWTDINAYVKEFPLPDYGFTPDGEFPICNIEKGMADIEITIPVSEKNDGDLIIKSINGGRATNVVPDECLVELILNGHPIKLKAYGTSAHSCMPEKGDNAIINMCKIIGNLSNSDSGIAKVARLIVEKFQDIYCSNIGLYSEDEYYNGDFIHRNTVSPTLIRTEGNRIHININVRFNFLTKEADIEKAFEKLAEEMGGEISKKKFLPAIYVDKDKPFIRAFAEAYEKVTGFKNEFSLEYGGTYAKAMPNIVSWGPIFPGEEDTCHQENERINIDNLILMTKIFAEAIGNIVFSEENFK